MGKINEEDYREAKAIDIKSVLNHYGYYAKANGNYTCPFHNDKTASTSILKVKGTTINRLNCFCCHRIASTIDIVMEMEGVDQFTAIRKLLGSELRTDKRANKIPLQEQQQEGKTTEQKYEYVISKCRPLSKDNYGYIIPYLNSREIKGILDLLETLKANGTEVEILHNYFQKKNYIVYHFSKYKFMIQKAIDRSEKRNLGHTRPVYFKINNSNDWYVVEGIEDCFSLLLVHNVNVVCLNSTSNINKFIEAVKLKHSKDINFIIATDNDHTGEKAKNELIRFFKENNVKYSLYKSFYDYAEKYNLKDFNECLCHSKLKTEEE